MANQRFEAIKTTIVRNRNIIIGLAIMVFLILIAGAHYSIVESGKQIARQIIALKEAEKMLLAKQIDELILADKKYKLEEKVAFETSLTKSITKLRPKLDEKTTKRIALKIIAECSEKYLDPILITALIWRESRFDPMAHSNKGAVGLMQVRYKVWKEDPILQDSGVDAKYKLYWIDLNVKCGTEIFAKYYKEANYDIVRTLYRYSTGSRNIPKDIPDFTIEYVNKILLTAYRISDSIRKDNNDLPDDN